MGKLINGKTLSNTLKLSECSDGWWLWDTTREMNLAIKAKSAEDAFIEALHYYQDRLTRVERDYRTLRGHVDAFVTHVSEEDES